MFKLARLTDEQWRRNPAERMRLATLIQEAAAGYYGVFALPYSELLEEIASQILAAGTELESIWVLREGDVPAGVAAAFDASSLAIRRQVSLARFLKRLPREDRRSCLARMQEYVAEIEPYSGDGLYLARVAVSPAYRKRGVASRLMKGLIAEIGGEKIALHVATDNAAAIALYRKLGFNPLLPHAKQIGLFIRYST